MYRSIKYSAIHEVSREAETEAMEAHLRALSRSVAKRKRDGRLVAGNADSRPTSWGKHPPHATLCRFAVKRRDTPVHRM